MSSPEGGRSVCVLDAVKKSHIVLFFCFVVCMLFAVWVLFAVWALFLLLDAV